MISCAAWVAREALAAQAGKKPKKGLLADEELLDGLAGGGSSNRPSKQVPQLLRPGPSGMAVLESIEIIPVKNVDEVLKVALTKPLKRVEWVEIDNVKKTKDEKSEVTSRH